MSAWHCRIPQARRGAQTATGSVHVVGHPEPRWPRRVEASDVRFVVSRRLNCDCIHRLIHSIELVSFLCSTEMLINICDSEEGRKTEKLTMQLRDEQQLRKQVQSQLAEIQEKTSELAAANESLERVSHSIHKCTYSCMRGDCTGEIEHQKYLFV